MVDAGAALEDCLIIEVFAGTARVTACLKQLGVKSAFGTDHVRHKQAMAQVVTTDLTTRAGVELLMQWLSNPSVLGIFLAPPCGSASRARSIPLKRKHGDRDGPKPLRSDAHPNGLPGMQFLDRLKISKANRLYHLTSELVKWAVQEGCLICIENPQFSYFWQTTFMQGVLHLLQFTIFQTCRYGGKRPKRTMLAFNAEEFKTINKMCTGASSDHQHEKWGVINATQTFATASEAAYPMTLARTLAAAFVLALHHRGINMPPETIAEIATGSSATMSTARAQTGLQAKASRLPPLIPTYAAKIALTGFQSDLPEFDINSKCTSPLTVETFNQATVLPKGAKLLHVAPPMLPEICLQKGVVASGQSLQKDEVERFVERCGIDGGSRVGPTESQIWGIPWTEEQFAEQMLRFGHPATVQSGLPDALRDAVEIYKKMSVQERMAHRAAKMGFWLKRLVQLKDDEKRLKTQMDGEVVKVIGQKNILLWEEMLKATKYIDMDVVREFREGSDLVGCVERTGLWPTKFQPAVISVDELHEVAKLDRAGIGGLRHDDSQDDLLEPVWAKTMEEVESGALVGPIPLEQIPADVPLSRRFGIRQGQKVRCIDDFSKSSVNQTVQTSESPKPHTLDIFAAMCIQVMTGACDETPWLGRTFDLTGAYRQCAVRPSSSRYSYIVATQPQSKELFGFRMRALPFGAVRSVHSFLRFSHSMWHLLVSEFLILTTNYFDDFVTLASVAEAPSVQSCTHMFFRMLGWLFAESGDKAHSFANSFQALGVLINISEMHRGLVSVGNTDSRRTELIAALDAAIQSRKLHRGEALRLRGRLQFASGHLFGRIAKATLSIVTHHAYYSRSANLNDEAVVALKLHRHLLYIGRPRELSATSGSPWFIQTDASLEPKGDQFSGGIGAVLFGTDGKPQRFFSEELTDEMLGCLNPHRKKTAIFECEFMALFCAMLVWGDAVSGLVVFYTDNNAVRDVMISCSTNNGVAKGLLVATLALEGLKQISPWYARVPTDSNLSDGPSRMKNEKVSKLGAIRDLLDVQNCWDRHVALVSEWGGVQATRFPSG